MRVYFAVSSKGAMMGGFNECIDWSQQMISGNKAKLIKVVRWRPGDRLGRLVCEIDCDGLHHVSNGRQIPASILKRNRVNV